MNAGLFQRVYSRTVRIVAGICTTAVFGINTLPHFFPEKTIAATQGIYDEDVSDHHKTLLDEACKCMNIDERCMKIVYTSSFGTNSAGSVFLPNKAVIGLPRNAVFKNPEDVTRANITFENKPIDWNSNAGKALIDSVLLDDDNIKFLIGHELTHIKDLNFLQTTAHATGCFYGFYKAGVFLPTLVKGQTFFGIILMNVLIWTIGLTVYFDTRKQLAHRSEYIADEKSALLGRDYCTGGISYMRKRLKNNRVIRKLRGVEGEQAYSKVGDYLQEDSTHPKRTDRLKKLKETMLEYDNNNSVEKILLM